MKLAIKVSILFVIATSATIAAAQDAEQVPQPIPRLPAVYVTADEMANPHLYHQQYDYQVYQAPPSLGPPPENAVVRPGEFEEMDATIIALVNYGAMYHGMWASMVKAFSFGGHTVIISDDVLKGLVEPLIYGEGVDESMYSWLNYPIDSIWIRDYGPELVVEEDGTRHVIDAAYHPERPLDDAIPKWIAAADWISADGPELEVHEHEHGINGGNIMTDGAGTCFFSDIIYGYEKPAGWTDQDVDTLMTDYYGCEQIISLNPICNDGTGHIDLYAKVMEPTSILLGEFSVNTYFDGSQDAGGPGHCGDTTPNDYQDQEDNLAIIQATTNIDSEQWQITRLHMLEPFYDDVYGWVYRSYMNSEVFNGAVAMPSYYNENGPETAAELLDLEDQAIDSYEAAAPGVTVFPIASDHIIFLAGAMHCIAHEIPPDPAGGWQMPEQYCGDGYINGDEECDGPAMDGLECTDFDYVGGDLACDMYCAFDFGDCEGGSDTDTDTDSDADTDTTSDAGSGAGGGGGDDCGCAVVGLPQVPSLIALLLE